VAREAGGAVLLDADGYAPELEPLLGRIDFPVVSREFAEALGGPEAALGELAARGARFPVVTLGEDGCRGGPPPGLASPSFRVEARDTTGAGDVFHAAFGWAVLEGLGPVAALRAANAAAAMSCRALGAQGGLPTRAELEAFLAGGPARPEGAPQGPGAADR
jgi:sulfofructose kinase